MFSVLWYILLHLWPCTCWTMESKDTARFILILTQLCILMTSAFTARKHFFRKATLCEWGYWAVSGGQIEGWLYPPAAGAPVMQDKSDPLFSRFCHQKLIIQSIKYDIFLLCLAAKECGGVLTDQQRIIQSPGFPDEYQDEQICYWHIRVRLGQRVRLHFLEFDVEDDTACLADFLEVYDSYDDIAGFAGRWDSRLTTS